MLLCCPLLPDGSVTGGRDNVLVVKLHDIDGCAVTVQLVHHFPVETLGLEKKKSGQPASVTGVSDFSVYALSASSPTHINRPPDDNAAVFGARYKPFGVEPHMEHRLKERLDQNQKKFRDLTEVKIVSRTHLLVIGDDIDTFARLQAPDADGMVAAGSHNLVLVVLQTQD